MEDQNLDAESQSSETQSSMKVYTFFFFAFSFYTLFIFALFIQLLDPFGQSALNAKDPSQPRYGRTALDRDIKPNEMSFGNYQILFLGTSRVKQGIDPRHMAEATGKRIYNGGIDFMSLPETELLLQRILRWNHSLETVYIELNFNHFYFPGFPKLNTGLFAPLKDYSKLHLSFFGMRQSLSQWIKEKGYGDRSYYFLDELGYAVSGPSEYQPMRENVLAHVLPYYGDRASMVVDERQRVTSENFALTCERNKISCKFVVLPYNPLDICASEVIGYWPKFAEAIEFVSGRHQVFDFTELGHIADEKPSPNSEHWFDVNHFRPSVGRHVQLKLAGHNTDLFGGFDASLSPKDRMQRWSRMCSRWQVAEPEIYQRARAMVGVKVGAPR